MFRVEAIHYGEIRKEPELLAEYAAESGVAGIGPVNPQWALYAAMEAAGALQVFAVYADEAMVGFATVLCAVMPHYGVMVANLESLFVSSAWRHTRAGAMLLRMVHQHAVERGCKALGRWRHGRSLWRRLPQPV